MESGKGLNEKAEKGVLLSYDFLSYECGLVSLYGLVALRHNLQTVLRNMGAMVLIEHHNYIQPPPLRPMKVLRDNVFERISSVPVKGSYPYEESQYITLVSSLYGENKLTLLIQFVEARNKCISDGYLPLFIDKM